MVHQDFKANNCNDNIQPISRRLVVLQLFQYFSQERTNTHPQQFIFKQLTLVSVGETKSKGQPNRNGSELFNSSILLLVASLNVSSSELRKKIHFSLGSHRKILT